MKKRVAIIDYGMGNLFSVQRACEFAGLDAVVTSQGSVVRDADAVILPGVGAFGDAMENLAERGLIGPIREKVDAGNPFMGICLGMQLVFTESEEFGIRRGLDLIPGRVVKFEDRTPTGERVKVPHVGWNRIVRPEEASDTLWKCSPLRDIREGEFMYFVHSFYAMPADCGVVLSETAYGGTRFCSSILQKNVFACQFHPEKSAGEGLTIYKNWAAMMTGAER